MCVCVYVCVGVCVSMYGCKLPLLQLEASRGACLSAAPRNVCTIEEASSAPPSIAHKVQESGALPQGPPDAAQGEFAGP